MPSTLRPYISAGAVIVGAGLIAITPITVPRPGINTVRDVALTSGDSGSDTGFTIGDLSFTDPTALSSQFVELSPGYESLSPVFANAPLLSIGTDSLLGILHSGYQEFTVDGGGGATLGTVDTSVNVQDLLGIGVAQFTVHVSTPTTSAISSALTSNLDFSGADFTAQDLASALADYRNAFLATGLQFGTGDITSAEISTALSKGGIDLSGSDITDADIADALNTMDTGDLPVAGTVYSITNIGGGLANVYEAVPNADGTAASSITDTLVTPFGNIDVPTTYDAIAPLDPATPLEALGNTSSNPDVSDNAFTIDGTTFDPGSDGINPSLVLSLGSFAPLLNFDANSLNVGSSGQPIPTQDFQVYTNGTDDGTVHTSLFYSDLLGIDSTQFTVQAVTPTGDATDADLPAVGTVYSVTDLGSGYENVYQAVPGSNGGAASITDTLVTPFGNLNVPTSYDATAPLDPAGPLGALAAASGNADLSGNAFTIDGTTFDPGSDGFTTLTPIFGIAPLLEIGGISEFGRSFNTQHDVAVYDSSGADLGSVNLGEGVSNVLGIDTTQFTVTGVDAADGLSAAQTAELPAEGTVYSVTDLGSFTNVYEAIPNADGTAASSITDTLITPFGNIDLSKLFGGFDAIAPLNAGDVVDGVSTAGSAAASSSFDLFDPSTWF